MKASPKVTPTNSENYAQKARSLFPVHKKPITPKERADLEEAFPNINPEFIPLGNRILIQLRALPKKTKGGLIITQSVRNESLYDEQIGKIIAIGASAFHSQTTMTPWPEGEWFDLEDFVRVPKFGGDKQWTYTDSEGTETVFVVFRDFDVIGKLTGNPLKAKGYFAGNDGVPVGLEG